MSSIQALGSIAVPATTTSATETPFADGDYLTKLPLEIKRIIFERALENNGKWIQKATKHPKSGDYDTDKQDHNAPWWDCTDALDCGPDCEVHGQGLQVMRLKKQLTGDVDAFLQERATWFLINWLGYHALTKFDTNDPQEKKNGWTISIQITPLIHIADVFPRIGMDDRFDIEKLGVCQDDELLGANTRILNTRNNVFAFLRDHIEPFFVGSKKNEELPHMSFLIELGRNCLVDDTWAKDNIYQVVAILINPFEFLMVKYRPAWEVWPIRVQEDKPAESGYDTDDSGESDLDAYVDAPTPAIMTKSYAAWVKWHWRWYENEVDDSGSMTTICYGPELQADGSFGTDFFHAWAYSRAQQCANNVADLMKAESRFLDVGHVRDRSFVGEIIEIVHSAQHVNEKWRIWLLSKALLLNETCIGHKLREEKFTKWVKELRDWAALPCPPAARGDLPDICQGRGERYRGFVPGEVDGDQDDSFPEWYDEHFTCGPNENRDDDVVEQDDEHAGQV